MTRFIVGLLIAAAACTANGETVAEAVLREHVEFTVHMRDASRSMLRIAEMTMPEEDGKPSERARILGVDLDQMQKDLETMLEVSQRMEAQMKRVNDNWTKLRKELTGK